MRKKLGRIKRKINTRLKATWKTILFKSAKKIIIGSANTSYPGWLSTDKDTLDITNRHDFECYWKPGSRTAFFAEHVVEHLEEEEAKNASANCFEFLKSGGRLRIAVPDGFNPDPAYIELVRSYGPGPGADEHKCIYNYRSLRKLLNNAGFHTVLLEYYDENGTFHFNEWNSVDGHIVRSKRYDPRNKDGRLHYTSLIADAIKPQHD